MSRHVVPPLKIGRVRQLFLKLAAETWGIEWLRNWLIDETPENGLYERIVRDICATPDDWLANEYGVIKKGDKLGVYDADGPECVAVAEDDNRQFYPPVYWRWMLYRVAQIHRDYQDAKMSDLIAGRI